VEKRKPRTPLSEIKRLLLNPDTRLITRAALAGAVALGLDKATLIEAVQALTQGDFYKSMTTHGDHTQWQDVYRGVGWLCAVHQVASDGRYGCGGVVQTAVGGGYEMS